MALICPLCSGSSGNSILVQGGSSSILVDAGGTCKSICAALTQAGSSYEELDAIVLTHEHSDHIKALPVLLKKAPVPVYATEAVLEYLAENLKIPANVPLVPLNMAGFCIHDLHIAPFPTPHDSVGSVGYRIALPEGQHIGIATDLGHFTPQVEESLSGCQAILLESNYDDGMILCSPDPYPLKRRIMSPKGHLSNNACASAAVALARKGTSRFILGHLSENNNMPQLAFQATQTAMDGAGMTAQEGFSVVVAKRSQCSAPLFL